MNFGQMDQQLQEWKAKKAELLQKRVDVMKKATRPARHSAIKYLADRIADASTDTIASVQRALSNFDINIRQIHVKDVDLVDRCESLPPRHARAGHPDQGRAWAAKRSLPAIRTKNC